MLTDIFLWLAPSPGLFMTVIGISCLIASFVYLVKVLYDNASDEPVVEKQWREKVEIPPPPAESRGLKVAELPDIEEMTEFMHEEGEQEDTADVTVTVFTHTSSDRVKLMNDTAPMIIEYWDRDYNLVDYNKTAAIFRGMASAPDRVSGLDEIDFGLSHQPSGELTRVMWANALSKTFEDGFLKFEYVTEKNGKTLYLDVTARCIRTSSGDVVVTYSSDVSATKEMIREKELKAIAEANSHAKSRFLAHMSHELRTPISAVLGIAEIQLHNQELTAEAEEAFGQIYRSSSTLVGILNDILDLSKIESGKMELIPKEYQVTGMIHDVAQMHAMTLETKSFGFNMDVDAKLPKELIGDELRIKQVLNNLLSNAFKYTEEGSVQFSAKREDIDRDGYTNIVFTIKDTGYGMTPEQVGRLLSEDYVRFNEENSNVPGTGLGISIVQVLVKLMDATMEIESTPGKGTKVTVTIPQQIVNSETIGKTAAQDLEKLKSSEKKLNFEPVSMAQRRVMVVDDILSNLYVARGLLELYDLQVETHDSALPAISGVRRGEVYDIIFMDYMMPGIDGIEATKMLRDMKYTGPIVALTANALVGQEEIFLENGFDDFLSKPIRTAALHEILMKYIKNKEEAPEVSSQSDDYYNSPDVIKMVVTDFLNTQNTTVIEIEEAIKAGDMESGQRLAHTTKNLALMLKENALAGIAQETEISFAKGEVPNSLMLLNFARELGQVYERLQED